MAIGEGRTDVLQAASRPEISIATMPSPANSRSPRDEPARTPSMARPMTSGNRVQPAASSTTSDRVRANRPAKRLGSVLNGSYGQRIRQSVKYSASPQVTRRMPEGMAPSSAGRFGSSVIARLPTASASPRRSIGVRPKSNDGS